MSITPPLGPVPARSSIARVPIQPNLREKIDYLKLVHRYQQAALFEVALLLKQAKKETPTSPVKVLRPRIDEYICAAGTCLSAHSQNSSDGTLFKAYEKLISLGYNDKLKGSELVSELEQVLDSIKKSKNITSSEDIGPGGTLFAEPGYPHKRNATLALIEIRRLVDPQLLARETGHLISALDSLALYEEAESIRSLFTRGFTKSDLLSLLPEIEGKLTGKIPD